jgi:cobalt-zinc-cadmium resistance protein CzcA
MLNKLIDFGVSNRLLVVLALITLAVAGGLIVPKLNLDAFPDVTKKWSNSLPTLLKR